MVIADIENFKSAKKALIVISLLWLALSKFDADFDEISIAGIKMSATEAHIHLSLLFASAYSAVFVIIYWRLTFRKIRSESYLNAESLLKTSRFNVSFNPNLPFITGCDDAISNLLESKDEATLIEDVKSLKISHRVNIFTHLINGLFLPLALFLLAFSYSVSSGSIPIDFWK